MLERELPATIKRMKEIQKQRQTAEVEVQMPRKLVAERIARAAERWGFKAKIINGDDTVVKVVAGSALVDCRLKSEQSGATLVSIRTDTYIPLAIGWGMFLVSFICIFYHEQLPPNVLMTGSGIFALGWLYCAIQKARSTDFIKKFKRCFSEAVRKF